METNSKCYKQPIQAANAQRYEQEKQSSWRVWNKFSSAKGIIQTGWKAGAHSITLKKTKEALDNLMHKDLYAWSDATHQISQENSQSHAFTDCIQNMAVLMQSTSLYLQIINHLAHNDNSSMIGFNCDNSFIVLEIIYIFIHTGLIPQEFIYAIYKENGRNRQWLIDTVFVRKDQQLILNTFLSKKGPLENSVLKAWTKVTVYNLHKVPVIYWKLKTAPIFSDNLSKLTVLAETASSLALPKIIREQFAKFRKIQQTFLTNVENIENAVKDMPPATLDTEWWAHEKSNLLKQAEELEFSYHREQATTPTTPSYVPYTPYPENLIAKIGTLILDVKTFLLEPYQRIFQQLSAPPHPSIVSQIPLHATVTPEPMPTIPIHHEKNTPIITRTTKDKFSSSGLERKEKSPVSEKVFTIIGAETAQTEPLLAENGITDLNPTQSCRQDRFTDKLQQSKKRKGKETAVLISIAVITMLLCIIALFGSAGVFFISVPKALFIPPAFFFAVISATAWCKLKQDTHITTKHLTCSQSKLYSTNNCLNYTPVSSSFHSPKLNGTENNVQGAQFD